MRDKTRYEKAEGPECAKYIKISSGRRVNYLEAERNLEDHYSSLIRWMSRAFKLSQGCEWDEQNLQWFVEHLKEMVAAWDHEIQKRHGQIPVREKIAALRQVEGRTDEERKIFLAKADELQRKLDEE